MSDRVLSTLADHLTAAFFLKDAEGRYRFVNRPWLELLHQDAGSVVGKRDQDLFDRRHANAHRALDRRVIETGATLELEEALAFGDGQRTYRITEWPVFDETGKPCLVCGTAVDVDGSPRGGTVAVSTPWQTEERLRESEERFRATFEQSAVGMAHFALDGHCLRANRKFAAMLAYDVGDVIGLHYSALTHPDDVHRVALVLQRMVDEQLETFQLEKRYLRKDGTAMWGQTAISTMRDAEGHVHLFNVACSDITERKENERRLHEIQGQLEAATSIAQVGFWEFDVRSNEVFLSPEWKRHLGYESWELPNRAEEWTARVHPDDWPTVLAQRRRAIEAPQQSLPPFEYRLRHKDGSYRWILSRIVPRLDEQGAVIKLTGTHLDVTERKAAEAERQARVAAETANIAKSEFLASMSHELRSPLNTILGFARLMANDPKLPETARQDLERILSSGEHLYSLVNQVLDLSKLESGYATFNAADFDLHLLLDDLRGLFAPAAVRKGLKLRVERRPGVPRYVRSDALKLRQVLINLLDNAIKFTTTGRIDVIVDRAAEDTAEPAENDAARLAFCVADSGPGIAPAELRHLFAAFVQAEAGRSQPHGTGLGLAISRGFVRLMGGEMKLDSALGRGTSAQFEIPVRIVAETPAPGQARFRRVLALAPGQPRYRIVVADDQAEARELVVRLLARLGIEVREAANGLEAIEAWEHWHPHLILMNLTMPVLDGLEAARRIRAAAKGWRVVIIAVTASAEDAERGKAQAAGCNDLLSKPFREADLFATLEKDLQIRFIYEEEAPAAPRPLDVHDLAALPEAERTALEDALVRLDPEAIERTIDAVRTRDAVIADALAARARDFQYESILSALRGGDPAGERPQRAQPT